jgi:hypothetical protein
MTAEKTLRGLHRTGVVRLGYRSVIVDLRRVLAAAEQPPDG